MENFEPKKLLILRILEILTEYSDAEHKLRQNDVISLLRIVYGMECERKAVALSLLRKMTSKNGLNISNSSRFCV